MGPVVGPFARGGDPFPGRNRCGMAHRGDEVALAAGLDTEHAEAGLGVVEGHPLDEADQVPRGRGLWSPLLAGHAGPGGRVRSRSRRSSSPRKADLARCFRSWRRSFVRGSVLWQPVISAPKVCMRVAARAVETPKSRSMSRRVSRVRSSFSSWLMASGMARSHRGLAGASDPGQPVALVWVGTISSAHIFRQVSRRFSKTQDPDRSWF